jgi:Rieske Fe-S protein
MWTSAGAVGLLLAGTGTRFVIGDSFQANREEWIRVATLADLAPEEVQQATYKLRSKDAWRTAERKGLLYVFGDGAGGYKVVNATCTHLGCNVQWKSADGTFFCPCHHATFSRTGEVVNGPTEQPLAELQTKIEDGVLYALL